MLLDGISEIVVRVRLKPDGVYALLGNLIRFHPRLHIVDGNERSLTMRLFKIDEYDRTEFHFCLAISYDEKLSMIRITTEVPEQREKLKDAAYEVVRMLSAYDFSRSIRIGRMTPRTPRGTAPF